MGIPPRLALCKHAMKEVEVGEDPSKFKNTKVIIEDPENGAGYYIKNNQRGDREKDPKSK